MNKKLVGIDIGLILLLIILCGCNEISTPSIQEEDRFLGTWKTDEKEYLDGYYSDTYKFFSDGNLSYINIEDEEHLGSWQLKEDKLIMNAEWDRIQIVYYYNFSDNDTVLTFNPVYGGKILNLYKQS